MLLARRKAWLLPSLIVTFLVFLLWDRAQQAEQLIAIHKQLVEAEEHPRVHWHRRPDRFPVASATALPTGTPLKLPRIQHKFGLETEKSADKAIREKRLAAVKHAFNHSWHGYKDQAWMKDEVAPITGGFFNTYGGWAATLVDTLDTLWIMGLHKEFELALKYVEKIDFTTTDTDTLNVFETTIRYLGGLLGAYDVSGGKYSILLKKATELGEILYSAFDTPNRMPVTRWDWMGQSVGRAQEAQPFTLTAEIGSLTLEFTRLSQLTGDPKYFDAVQRITDEFDRVQNKTKLPGMWPITVNAKYMTFVDHFFTLGGMSDSLYEYLPKEYLLLGGLSEQYRQLYIRAIEVIKKHALFRPLNKGNKDILLSGTVRVNQANRAILDPKAQHLACFAGGMVGIAAKVFERPDELEIARELTDGCIWAYESTPTGLMPEMFHAVPCNIPGDECKWDEKRWMDAVDDRVHDKAGLEELTMEDRSQYFIKSQRLAPGFSEINDPRFLLRPEAIESIFILYRITGDMTLQDQAWIMFQNIVNSTETEIAHAGVEDVTLVDPPKANKMESFWLAETLKYFYLTFTEPDVVDLDEYVLNTEAHPLRRPTKPF